MGGPFSPFLQGLRCTRCGREYAAGEVAYVCGCRPNVGSDLGTLDAVYDYRALREAVTPGALARSPASGLEAWEPLLPVAPGHLPPLPVGRTPLLHARRLGAALGMERLWVKDDSRNPSGSLKDRASAIAVALAQALGRETVATASTGNAAAALAALSAAAGLASVIFVPQAAPRAKIAQHLAYGSRVLAVEGSYDDAFDLCVAACDALGWYNRNTGYNPFMTEGKKTVALELAAQMAQAHGGEQPFLAPDAVLVPVGDGCIIGGVHKGFQDLLALGWIRRMPRIYGIQSTQSSALYRAWQTGLEIPEPVEATTRADSIGVNAPRDPVKALRAVRETGGAFLAVEDSAILQAILPLARRVGVFPEPAGAAAYAGLLQALESGTVRRDETVVLLVTGTGLKDVNAAMEVAGEPTAIPPDLEAVREALGRE